MSASVSEGVIYVSWQVCVLKEPEHFFRKDRVGRPFFWGAGWVKPFGHMDSLRILLLMPISEFRPWNKKSIIFDWSPFQHHLLPLPPFPSTHLQERNPEHFIHLSTYLGLFCTLDSQKMIFGQWGVLFHKNIKFIWWTKIHPDELKSPWILLCLLISISQEHAWK